eukprot:CAMPEP_0170517758 /NCGR_PEP_ID=MMETSP0209-20121228/3637_1 /TAXON_ID=665100 ORGANISM="Litonotus pictus, Strain P1" /NCGR_SAMPLE_ID=MMETSP0209 /ASSEMBLY_ACC=CAM_ASM_000301 /LENGTH=131 /DNA_ID=CAMNT_0010803093 /DNA_START=14 /DNA_END=410 /DNA_ORIENTATION=+
MSESKPEDKGLKDENYNDTKKKDDPTAGKKEICGFVAIPGLEFRSKQVFASCSKCQATGLTDVDAFWSVKNFSAAITVIATGSADSKSKERTILLKTPFINAPVAKKFLLTIKHAKPKYRKMKKGPVQMII